MIALDRDETVFLHFAELVAHRAAVDIQIVGELLAVEGDLKFAAAPLDRFVGQEGQQAAADRLGTRQDTPAREVQILARGDEEQIADQLVVEAAGILTDMQHAGDIQKQNFGVLGGDHAVHQRFPRHAGVGFREHLPGVDMIENAFVAPDVVDLDGNAARKDKPDGADHITCVIDHRALGIAPGLRLQAAQHLFNLLGGSAAKENGICQKFCIHFTLLVVITTDLLQ